MRVNVGCGSFYAPDWVNVDLVHNTHAGVVPDVLGSLAALPVAAGSVDMLYAGHVLEHVPLDRMDATLAEVARVLAPAGRACFVGPDVHTVLHDWKAGACDWDLVLRALEGPDSSCGGSETWDGSCHTFNATEARVLAMVARVWPDAHAVPIVSDVLDEWPVPFRVNWQWAVLTR